MDQKDGLAVHLNTWLGEVLEAEIDLGFKVFWALIMILMIYFVEARTWAADVRRVVSHCTAVAAQATFALQMRHRTDLVARDGIRFLKLCSRRYQS